MPASAPKAFASDVNSIFSAAAKLLMTSTLSHRSSENSVYWLLDGDDSRIRQVHAQHNLAVLRRMAFNLLPSENSAQIDIAAKRERAAWKTGYLLKILSQQDAIALPDHCSPPLTHMLQSTPDAPTCLRKWPTLGESDVLVRQCRSAENLLSPHQGQCRKGRCPLCSRPRTVR